MKKGEKVNMSHIGQRYCEICDVYINRKNFSQHLNTQRHAMYAARHKEQFELEKSEVKPSQKEKKTETRKRKAAESKEPKNKATFQYICKDAQCPTTNSAFAKKNKLVSKQGNNHLKNNMEEGLVAKNMEHILEEAGKTQNDLACKCTCDECVEFSRCVAELEENISSSSNSESNKIHEPPIKYCIDDENPYDKIVLFPTVSSVEGRPLQKWKTMEDLSEKLSQHEDIAQAANTEKPGSPHPSLNNVRQMNTHKCEKFGENLPEFLKLSHCHEEMFHFFGFKDTRTNFNTLIVITK